jgi:lysozyme
MTVRKTAITVASAASLAAAVPMVKHYEGLWLTVKPDKLAHGLPTGGYGETENVRLGETHDEKYWANRLAQRLPEYDRKIGTCVHVELPDGVRAVAISLAYNAGPAAVCRSPMVAKWNAGKIREGCEAIRGWYIRAGGQVRQGLINRRNDEARKCLAGIQHSDGATPRAGCGRDGLHCPEYEKPMAPSAVPPKKSWWSWIFK